MPTRNVNLTERFDRLIDAEVKSGRYSNASEVVREGLRLLEERNRIEKAKLKWLRQAAKEGFDQIEKGQFVTLRSDADIHEMMERLAQEARRPERKRA